MTSSMHHEKTYSDSARVAYDAFAPVYDEFNAQNDHEVWVGQTLLPELEKHGLPPKGLVLDVGCGTGLAMESLMRRGWSYWGVDASPEMRARAVVKAENICGSYEGDLHLRLADARDLPALKEFDLVLLLNDVVNYLTEDDDLERCFSGVEKNLAPGGLVCFDVNTLGLMRSNFAASSKGLSRSEWTWRGSAGEVDAGGTYEAELSGPGVEPHVHRQRHWTDEEIRGALEATGLTCLARLGQREEGERVVLEEPADEVRDSKVIYIGGHGE